MILLHTKRLETSIAKNISQKNHKKKMEVKIYHRKIQKQKMETRGLQRTSSGKSVDHSEIKRSEKINTEVN
jgi:hypothetical protein